MSKFDRSSSKSYGSWMAAQIKFRGDKIGCCPILKDGTILTDNKSVVAVSRKNVPDNLTKEFDEKYMVIKLSEDKRTIESFKPYSGQHPAKFIKFGGREGETATPRTEKGEFGPYQVCYAVFEIVDGPYKGCTTSHQVPYLFEEGNDERAKFNVSKGKFLERTEEFLDTVIGEFDPPKFSDNLLPLFQKMALRANKTVGLVFKKGFVVTLVELDQPKKSKKADSEPPWTPDEE